MDWKEVTITTTTAGAEVASEILMEAGAAGTAIEDRVEVEAQQRLPGDWDFIDDAILRSMDADVRVTAWYPMDGRLRDTLAFIGQRIRDVREIELGFDAGSLAVTTGDVKDEDWENSWKQYYKPFTAGGKLLVKPVWEQAEADGRVVIEMEPGMAFGTGTHETTFMCLEMLDGNMKPDMLVWDIGCGTGILGVAAALLGARQVAAVDRDPVAVLAANNNAKLNRVQHIVDVHEGDLMKGLKGTPDLIVANIIAEVIIAMAGDAYQKLIPGGMFICSGIILSREEAVREALTKAGFAIVDARRMGEWAAFAAGKA